MVDDMDMDKAKVKDRDTVEIVTHTDEIITVDNGTTDTISKIKVVMDTLVRLRKLRVDHETRLQVLGLH
jgi:hypothetical protein